MGLSKTIWAGPRKHLAHARPDNPVLYFSPVVLQATARRFLDGFPGLVTYAVKANPDAAVLGNLVAAGVSGFDVASPAEIALIARIAPGAAMHYNNPVRSPAEIAAAVRAGVASYAVDSLSELEKLIAQVPPGHEIAVRFKLPVEGAAYSFGAKFGATAESAVRLLRRVTEAGHIPALTFHPGTQCTRPQAWEAYIRTAARIAADAGVRLARLNVGGGFPSHRLTDQAPQLEAIFALIERVTAEAFGDARPALVCEPGRGLVADAYALAVQVKAVRDGQHVFMSDGTYGAMDELPLIGAIDRIEVLSPQGLRRRGPARPRICFGPTCDSVDRLPGEIALPEDIAEGDSMLIFGMGAYSLATMTRFNGFGDIAIETVTGFAA